MAGQTIQVSPEALRRFVWQLRTEIQPQTYSASRLAWVPIGAGPPFGSNFPSSDVLLLLRKHMICADALARRIAAFINKIEALADVGLATANAYVDADDSASVTAAWVQRTFIEVETTPKADASPSAGSSQVAID